MADSKTFFSYMFTLDFFFFPLKTVFHLFCILRSHSLSTYGQ